MRKFLAALLFLPALLQGAHLSPWTGRDFEIISQAELGLSTNAIFLDLTGRTSYNRFAGEFEANFAHSKYQKGLEGDALALTVRYQLKDDVIEDPFSLWVGLTARKVFTNGLRDSACFYHGGVEGELHAAIGKEWSCEQFWTRRLWSYAKLGIADLGWPWMKGALVWERNWWDRDKLALEVIGEAGFGSRKLHHRHFRGYGPVRYRYLELGGKYTHQFEFGGSGEVGVKWRPLAQNCPRHWAELRFAFVYPFGL